MDQNLFEFLINVLRILEKEDYSSNTIENSIVALIDAFDSKLSQEQKDAILNEFVKYEMIRKAREDEEYKKREKIISEMKYRELVDAAIGYAPGT